MRIRSALLFVILLGYAAKCGGEELDGSLHFTGGTNKNPNSVPAFSADLHLDPALFFRIKSQIFDAGLAYDRVQGHGGISVDFRAKLAFLRCYGSEYQCEAKKKFWLTAIPSVGKRWGDGGLGGYAATQLQAVFDLRHELACCKFAITLHHPRLLQTRHPSRLIVTGQRAFEGKSQLSVASAILEKEPAPISTLKPLAPLSLEHVVRRCLAKDPDDRWQTARDVALELNSITQSEPAAETLPVLLRSRAVLLYRAARKHLGAVGE